MLGFARPERASHGQLMPVTRYTGNISDMNLDMAILGCFEVIDDAAKNILIDELGR